MTDGAPNQDPAEPGMSPRNVPALLARLHREGFTGTVSVSGTPGGTIHLRDGLIGAIETPGTPSVESTLLKSGRVDDEGWAAGQAAVRDGDDHGTALVGLRLVGAAELEVVCTATVFEGAFAMSVGPPAGWEVEGPAPTVLAPRGLAPHRVAEETARRLALVSRSWGPPAELAKARMRPSARADRVAGQLTSRYQAVLAVANARRTPRDLAFTLGRGLYGVMADLIRMDELQLIQWEDRAPVERPSTAPRVPPAGRSAPPPPVPAVSLPRRTPGAGRVEQRDPAASEGVGERQLSGHPDDLDS
ncbi:hypothetical protein OG349_01065 [Streptomyces sp. NBC_01317]|uniref:hypothetical protein n=1 Tax=Streptomyces sp. NBC_01317 TaxID=2903822 RepID=UPI002E148AFD|nr:hypothetical protein OG349_01065 [Streptomyces sp. NBC_01317]